MTKKELLNKAIESWRNKNCKGTAVIPPQIDSLYMIKEIIYRCEVHAPIKILIVCNGFNERSIILTYLKTDNNNEKVELFKKWLDEKLVQVLTTNFIKDRNYSIVPTLTILYNVDDVSERIFNLFNAKFRLCIIERLYTDSKITNRILANAPMLEEFSQTEVDKARISTPVEEMRIEVPIPSDSEDYKLLEEYNRYISDSITIFGSFDIMNKIRTGDKISGMSSMQLCNQIAIENGWNDHLDMTSPFNRQIDECFNPAKLQDRVSFTYDYIKKREILITSYPSKLDVVCSIIETNKDKKILIINKHANFASVVTEHINQHFKQVICGNYHDKLDPIPAINEFGQPVIYKTGRKAGERKFIGAQAQKTLNNTLFSKDGLNILSANNAPDKSLCGKVDIIIFTSSKCDDVSSYLYRFYNVIYGDKLKVFTLFCPNTIEESALENKVLTNSHLIVKNCEE